MYAVSQVHSYLFLFFPSSPFWVVWALWSRCSDEGLQRGPFRTELKLLEDRSGEGSPVALVILLLSLKASEPSSIGVLWVGAAMTAVQKGLRGEIR